VCRDYVELTGLVRRSGITGPVLETDGHFTSAEFARAATEEAADALIAGGEHVMVMSEVA
jgi:hypothetical protein